jgi:predicted phage terminase large subunit-like protein
LELSRRQISQLQKLPLEDQRKVLDLIEAKREAVELAKARNTFMGFAKYSWPAFISGRHHKVMADAFDRIVAGDLKRLIIAMPPRHTKSMFGSFLLPSYYLGHYPHRKIIQTSNTGELAVGFGRQVRDLINEDDYQTLFPNTSLKADAKAAGRWSTSEKGEYYACGTGGAVTGRGADLLIIDDPHTEQQGQSLDPAVFDAAYEWYTSGPRQRLQPRGAIVVIATRWSLRDLTGRILKDAAKRNSVDEWEIIEFPAILPSGNALWPEFWPIEELRALEDELPSAKWNAQYQQNPTSEEGALVKRAWWNTWEGKQAPECDFIIQCWDTAFLKTETADYSACTTWGVFYLPDDNGESHANIILLDAFRDRMEFPALKKKAMDLYEERSPDAFIVEAKASGMPLIFELRAMGIPVAEHKVGRGTVNNPNNKHARVSAISDVFASGMVWAPDTPWATMVIDELAAFPAGENDDLVDTVVMAIMRFRHGGFVQLPSDEPEEITYREKANYYDV